MTFETADDVLEHFGVKGMKWGVRKQSDSSSGRKGSSKQKTSKKKRAIQVAAVTGAVVASVIVAHHAGVRLSSIRGGSTKLPSGLYRGDSSNIAKSALRAQNIMSRVVAREGRTRVSDIPRTPPIPRPRVTQSAAGDIARMRSEIASSIRAANTQLRDNDNRLNIPIHARTYLTEWD